MNNETLKRDLCARLMDGVKVRYKRKVWDIRGIRNLHVKRYLCVDLISIQTTDGNFIEKVKPYLFPTSALTKPIQLANYNNGEPFVPVEMMKEVLMMEWCSVYDDAFDELLLPDCRFNALPFDFIELLNRWHINYRLSPDQFIEVTEEFNPYK